MKVALVHDYLREYGGAERVLEALHKMFPDAPVYVSFFDKAALGEQASRFAAWDIQETKMTQFPFYKKLFSPYRVFAAWCFEQLDLSSYDLVISSTNAYQAKAVHAGKNAKHISYIHTPSRALYGYSTRTNWRKNFVVRYAGELINFWMRYVDFKTSQRPDVLVANSKTTQQRITKFWRRDSVIIPPPVGMVDDAKKPQPSSERDYLLFVGRLVLSKHPEIAVAVSKALDLPLKIAGTGIMLEELQKSAGPKVEFFGSVDDEQLQDLYAHAKVLLYPAEDEDFGIVPIEAFAAGTPVVAHNSGEPRFTVQENKNGLLVSNLDKKSWTEIVGKAWKKNWNEQEIVKSARQYSLASFQEKLNKLISSIL